MTKTAAEYHDEFKKHRAELSKEKREFKRAQEELEAYEDLRDDVMRMVDNSGLSHETIHERCGPHPDTLKAWDEKITRKPQLGKMRSVLRILGKDFGIIDRKTH